VNYDSAGTVEFVRRPGQEFFLSRNEHAAAVEHPVTELITGHRSGRQMIRSLPGKN